MIITCDKCARQFDDATCWTICPHNPLHVDPKKQICKEHDLFDCPFHGKLDTSKFAVLTRADLIQEVLSIWDASVQIEPTLHKEYEIARYWLTHTWTEEELGVLTTLTITIPDKPPWWKFWQPGRETFREAWPKTMVFMDDIRRRFMF